jgi:hypothetical protein
VVPYSRVDVADSSVAQTIVVSVGLTDASAMPEITGGVVSVCSVIVTAVVVAAVAVTVVVVTVALDVAGRAAVVKLWPQAFELMPETPVAVTQ